MRLLAAAALVAGFAATPIGTKAADLLLIDSTGHPVGIVVTAPLSLSSIPATLFDEQDALLAGMMRRVEAAFDPAAPAGLASFKPLQPGAAVITTSFSDGRTSCSRTVTYEQTGRAAPIVQIHQSGTGCGALPPAGDSSPTPVALPAPAPGVVNPPAPSTKPQLTRVDYRHPAPGPAIRKG